MVITESAAKIFWLETIVLCTSPILLDADL